MNPALSIPEYGRLAGRVRGAWVRLNRAGDTPYSHRSILDLQSALDEVLSVDAALHGDSPLESAVARHHHSFLRSQRNAPEILRTLSARARELRLHPNAPEENAPDAVLAHSAIPVIWRMIRSLRHEIWRRRPPPCFLRLARRCAQRLHDAWIRSPPCYSSRQIRRMAKRLFALMFAGALLAYVGRFALPWGCWIAYGSGDHLDSIQGWSVAAALVHDYGTGRPLPWMRRDGWSARWQGILLVPESAEYAFFAQCAGGLRLWIDGDPLIDNWSSEGWRSGQHARRTLTKGPHALRMDFRDRGGHSAVRVRWTRHVAHPAFS